MHFQEYIILLRDGAKWHRRRLIHFRTRSQLPGREPIKRASQKATMRYDDVIANLKSSSPPNEAAVA